MIMLITFIYNKVPSYRYTCFYLYYVFIVSCCRSVLVYIVT